MCVSRDRPKHFSPYVASTPQTFTIGHFKTYNREYGHFKPYNRKYRQCLLDTSNLTKGSIGTSNLTKGSIEARDTRVKMAESLFLFRHRSGRPEAFVSQSTLQLPLSWCPKVPFFIFIFRKPQAFVYQSTVT